MPADLPIRLVPYGDVLDRLDLLELHYQELATDKARMQLDPHREAYASLDAAGGLFCLGLFDHGEIVGYSANIVSPALHYRQLTVCANDGLFLAKAYRNGRNGKALIAATEAEAKARGAGLMLWHAKQATALDVMLRRWGYGVQDIIYSKGL